ncbi:hypothetical protein [Pontivivens insulae]|uniref:Uncharacterized protein n=1 Tax=Pontivivens insulae TaxID=1639689 RepID=A0A2R8A7G1_9RHOB|nr:hypothetical protein [Pontivivens insulae]RED18276.1 hypothetical protein DFR53_0471 [Pontivivens insulae]SPF28174.1 hypothetical protein POI8812_00472 [Pontivivens insulae]
MSRLWKAEWNLEYSHRFAFLGARETLSERPLLAHAIVSLATAQMVAAGLAATDGIVQSGIEVVLAALLAIVVAGTPIRRWEICLLGLLIVVTGFSFVTQSFHIAAVNAKQNVLGVLALVVFSRTRFRIWWIWFLVFLSVGLVYLGRYHFNLVLPYLHLFADPELNASRFGGLFLNVHYNAFFLAAMFTALITVSRIHWLGLWVMYLTASKFVALAYIAQLGWRLFGKRFLGYRGLAIIGCITVGGIFAVEPYLAELIDQRRFNSLYIILYQIGNIEYYERLVQFIPSSAIPIELNESFNIQALLVAGRICENHSEYLLAAYALDTVERCLIIWPHDGSNEIGLFALATHMGLPLGAAFLFLLLRAAKGFRLLILFSLIHNFFLLSPLILYIMLNYPPRGAVLFMSGQKARVA